MAAFAAAGTSSASFEMAPDHADAASVRGFLEHMGTP